MKARSLSHRTVIVLTCITCAVVGLVPDTPAALVDDLKISQLEQDVRELQRVIQQQARRIEALESSVRQSRAGRSPISNSADSSVAPATQATKSSVATSAWLQSANWDKLRVGMPESDLLRVLGPPTTSRKSESGNAQTLFYTLELAAGGFLSGQVIVTNERVLEIRKPILR